MTAKLSIRPSKDLRTNYAEISKLCRENPVAITVNGRQDIVCMSHEDYMNQIQELEDLRYEKMIADGLKEAEDDIKNGRVYSLEQVTEAINNRFANHKNLDDLCNSINK